MDKRGENNQCEICGGRTCYLRSIAVRKHNVHVHFLLKRIKQDMLCFLRCFINLHYTVFKLCGYKLSHSVHSGICELVIQTYFWHKRRNHDLIVV